MVKEETTYYAMHGVFTIGENEAGPNKFEEGIAFDTIGDAVSLIVRHARQYDGVPEYSPNTYGIRRVTKVTEYGVVDTYVVEEDL